jgi:3-deoxy-D-manno-octulosonate 8-phosphate phosphatase KdsC-like HAD superfamily phosphatase
MAIADFCDDRGLSFSVSLNGTTFLRMDNPPDPVPAHVRMPARIAPCLDGEPMSLIVAGEAGVAAIERHFGPIYADRVQFSRAYNGDGSVMLSLTAAGADKGAALSALCRALEIGPEETMAVGDSEVDLPMFAVAGLPVAMGNAPDAIRRAARVVAPHVDEDGAAWAITHFVLEGRVPSA